MSDPVSYLELLPSVLRTSDDVFWNRYLKILEKILTGVDDRIEVNGSNVLAISEILDQVSGYFYPVPQPGAETRDDFVDWLSGWVGLVLKEDWSTEKKQEAIANIIPLYRLRGTRLGLNELLNIYLDKGVTVHDSNPPFQVGITSVVGSQLTSDEYFLVEATVPDLASMKQRKKMVETIIEREMPVHADFKIHWKDIPALQVEVRSQVGMEMFIWGDE